MPDLILKSMACLGGAAGLPVAAFPAPCGQRLHLGPGLGQTRSGGGRHRHRPGKPFRVLRAAAQQAQRTGVIGAGPQRRRAQIAIRLVHQDQIGHLHDAALDPLQLVPTRRGQQQHEQVAQIIDHGFGLPHAHRFDQNDVKTGRFAQRHRLTRAACHAAKLGLRRRGTDEGVWVARQQVHPGLVAQDAAAGPCRRRVHRQHRHPQSLPRQHQAKAFDEGRLAHARRAGQADAQGLPPGFPQRRYQRLRLCPMIGARAFHQRDRPRQSPSVARNHAGGKLGCVHHHPRLRQGSAHRRAGARECQRPVAQECYSAISWRARPAA